MVESITIFKHIRSVNINCHVPEIVLAAEDKTVNKTNVHCHNYKAYMKGGKRQQNKLYSILGSDIGLFAFMRYKFNL